MAEAKDNEEDTMRDTVIELETLGADFDPAWADDSVVWSVDVTVAAVYIEPQVMEWRHDGGPLISLEPQVKELAYALTAAHNEHRLDTD